MKRKHSRAPFARTDGTRAPRPAAASSFRLPSALAVAIALSAVATPASAIVGGDTGTEDAASEEVGDAADDAAPEGPDAISCPPPLGGVPMPVRVHGSGCGCGSEGNDSGTAALLASAALAAVFVGRRRRD